MKKTLLLLLTTLFFISVYGQYPTGTTKQRNTATGSIWWTNGDAAGTYDGRGRIWDTTSMKYLDSVGTVKFLDGSTFTSSNLGYLTGIEDMITFNYNDGQRKEIRPFWYYATDTAIFNGISTVNNDYYRNPKTFIWNDTLFTTVVVTKGHDYTQGFMRIIKQSGATGKWKFSTQVSDNAILYKNNSIGYSQLDDTIYGIQYTVAYASDTILKLDRNFNRYEAVYFDKVASHVDTFLCISALLKDDSNYFYMGGYQRLSGGYRGALLRSKTPNDIANWDTIRTYPYINNTIRPEELSLFRGAGDTICVLMRSDFGKRTWISKGIYGVFSDARFAYIGANQPRGITIRDSIIIGTAQIIGWTSADNEIRMIGDTLEPSETDGNYLSYTAIAVSWDYGNNWYTFYLDRTRTERFGYDSDNTRMSSEVTDLVQMSGDTIRVTWAAGVYIDNNADYGDLNKSDFVVNPYQRGDVRFIQRGGVSNPKTTYTTTWAVDSLVLKDTANDKYFAIDVDNTVTNVVTNTDSTVFPNYGKFTGLSVGAKYLDAGRLLTISNTANTEVFSFAGGNFAYNKSTNPAIRLRQFGGTYTSRTATLSGISLGSLSAGGYFSGTQDVWSLDAYASQDWTSTTTLGSNVMETKRSVGLTSNYIVGFTDSLNNHWRGNSANRPIQLFQRHEFHDGNLWVDDGYIIADSNVSIPSHDTTTLLNYYCASGLYDLDVDGTLNNVTVHLPPLSAWVGKTIHINRIDIPGNTVTINGSGANINGSATATLTSQYQSYALYNNGTDIRIH